MAGAKYGSGDLRRVYKRAMPGTETRFDVRVDISGLDLPTVKGIAEVLKGRPELAKVEVHTSIVSRMGGIESASIWVTFVAIGGYVGKKGVDLLFELLKDTIQKDDMPVFEVELYHNTLTAFGKTGHAI
jgi:hypothetical protein